MISFKVEDMFSSRSAGAIVKSVRALDRRATVRVDMAADRVEIDHARAQVRELIEAIEHAGFTPSRDSAPAKPGAPVGEARPSKISFSGAVDVLLAFE